MDAQETGNVRQRLSFHRSQRSQPQSSIGVDRRLDVSEVQRGNPAVSDDGADSATWAVAAIPPPTASDAFLLSMKTEDKRLVMEKRALGNRGLEVSALGFGCMGLSASY